MDGDLACGAPGDVLILTHGTCPIRPHVGDHLDTVGSLDAVYRTIYWNGS